MSSTLILQIPRVAAGAESRASVPARRAIRAVRLLKRVEFEVIVLPR
jgi:hypothetical protein